MAAILPQLHLYHHTLQTPTHIQQAIYGSFTAPKQYELCCITGTGRYIELCTVDSTTGQLTLLYRTAVFGIIRSIQSFRLIGQNYDYILTAGDSGRITVLQYNAAKQCFVKVKEETYGRTGCRRAIAGQYLAIDPHGRAALISAIERQKFVYILNRDTTNQLTVSSPLEAHKNNIITVCTVGIDVGYDSPLFACIEYNYSNCNTEPIQLQLVYYELDLGVNNVTRKLAQNISNTSNLLISVPGDIHGPGGCIVCSADTLTYKRMDHTDIYCNLPRRYGLDIIDESKGLLVVSYATHIQKNLFFFLLQTELGDLFKLTITYNSDTNTVTELKCQYFDTIPVTTSLCILKTGFLFAANESASHQLYQFLSIGDNDTTPYTSSQTAGDIVQFTVRPLTNLLLIDELQSISPILETKLLQHTTETQYTSHIYSAVGTTHHSTLRDLQYGLLMNELAVSELPGVPTNIFTTKENYSDAYTNFIIVSFINATIVLRVSDTVEEISNSGINNEIQTLGIYTMIDNSIIQIHTYGLYIIKNNTRMHEWKTPNKKHVLCCTYNGRQVVLGLTGGELIYFELELRTNTLIDRAKQDLGNDIYNVTINELSDADQLRSPYIAVSLLDNTVRLLSCQADTLLQQVALQASDELPVSIRIITQQHTVANNITQNTYLYVGLKNGLLIRSKIDTDTGNLLDTRKLVLGVKPVKLHTVYINNTAACVALSSNNYISYVYNNKLLFTQLTYQTLDCVATFHSEQCTNGIIGCVNNTLHIITYNKLNTVFNERTCKLRYTPRKLLLHNNNQTIVTIESDQNTYSYATKQSLQVELQIDEQKSDDTTEINAKAGLGHWGSCIRLVDRATLQTLQCTELSENQAAFSICNVQFANSDEMYCAIGTAQSLTFTPKKYSSAAIHLYKYVNNAQALQYVHSTVVEDIPLCMIQYNKKLLVGIGTTLRLYDIGQKRLLRQIELRNIKSTIVDLKYANERIFVSTLSDSIQYVQYNAVHNTFSIIAISVIPRYITCSVVLDYDTIAAGDKFGNVFIVRASNDLKQHIEIDTNNSNKLTGAHNKLTEIASYHIGETITSLHKCQWQQGGQEWLLYTAIHGAIGALLPLSNKEDVDILVSLEMHMRTEYSNLIGRHHMSYRAYYTPIKSVSDGDLLQLYSELPYDRQVHIAEQLTSSPATLIKQLEDLRSLII